MRGGGGSQNTANRVVLKRWGVPTGGSVSSSEKRGSKPKITEEGLFTHACKREGAAAIP